MTEESIKTSRQKDLELFASCNFGEQDLDYFYATSEYLSKNSKKSILFISTEAFIDYCKFINKKFPREFFEYQYFFTCFYLNWWPSWGNIITPTICKIMTLSETWYKDYKKNADYEVDKDSFLAKKSYEVNSIDRSQKTKVLLLALEKGKLASDIYKRLAENIFILDTNNLDRFYQQPWIWHFGDPEVVKKIKVPAASDGPCDAIVIKTNIPASKKLELIPGMMGSAMRKEFDKLKGEKFQIVCDTNFAELSASGIEFYRMP